MCLFKDSACILIDCRYRISLFKDSQCINHDVHQDYAGVFTVPCCLQYREIVKKEALYNGVRRTDVSFQPYYLLTEHLVKLFKLSKSFFFFGLLNGLWYVLFKKCHKIISEEPIHSSWGIIGAEYTLC